MINYYNLQKINSEKIAESTLSNLDALSAAKIVRISGDLPIEVVSNMASLPTASDNIGYLFYVTDQTAIFYSTGDAWSELNPSAGRIWSWGSNNFGANPAGVLGDGTATNRSSPGTTAGGGTNWSRVTVSVAGHSAGIKTDGTLWTWGRNVSGALGDNTTTLRSSPGTTIGGGTNWKEVACGSTMSGLYTAAIKTDGTLWTWGANDSYVLGTANNVSRSSPGTTVGGGTNWKQVSAADGLISAVKHDGTLWTWGNNGSGQLGDGSLSARSSPGTTAGGGTNWKQVSCGNACIGAVKHDGTLWTWGSNSFGRIATGDTVSRTSPGTTAGGGTNWSLVSMGCNASGSALKSDGTIWTWGYNNYGQLGDGTTLDRSSPGTIAGGGTNWLIVSAGGYHVSAIKTNGTLWTWGYNSLGRLGDGTQTSRSSPGTALSPNINWTNVFSNGFLSDGYTLAIGTTYI